MYLDAFLEAFEVSDVTTLFFFSLEVELLLLELWCALDWCGAFGVELCCCVLGYGANWVAGLNLYGALGVDGLHMVAWGGANGVDKAVLACDGAFVVLLVYKQEIHKQG